MYDSNGYARTEIRMWLKAHTPARNLQEAPLSNGHGASGARDLDEVLDNRFCPYYDRGALGSGNRAARMQDSALPHLNLTLNPVRVAGQNRGFTLEFRGHASTQELQRHPCALLADTPLQECGASAPGAGALLGVFFSEHDVKDQEVAVLAGGGQKQGPDCVADWRAAIVAREVAGLIKVEMRRRRGLQRERAGGVPLGDGTAN